MQRVLLVRVAVAVAAVLLFQVPISYAALIDDDAPIDTATESSDFVTLVSEAELDLLYDERGQAVLDGDEQRVHQVEEEMKEAGVHFLSDSEVEDLTRESSQQQAKGFVILPAVDTLKQKNVSWSSVRRTVTYNKKKYEVQTLTAQPKAGYNCNLMSSGTAIIKEKGNMKAGLSNAIKAVASGTAGKIPAAAIAITIYDTVASFAKGISKNTIVTEAHITYTWASVETVRFKYVKPSGKKDSAQSLSFIDSKATVAIGVQFPKFVAKGVSVKPNVIQRKYTETPIPSGYGTDTLAVKAYNSFKGYSNAYLLTYKVSGPTKPAFTISFIAPAFPLHIY